MQKLYDMGAAAVFLPGHGDLPGGYPDPGGSQRKARLCPSGGRIGANPRNTTRSPSAFAEATSSARPRVGLEIMAGAFHIERCIYGL